MNDKKIVLVVGMGTSPAVLTETGWARRIAFPLKGRSSAGHPGQSLDRAWEGKREDG